MINVCCNYCGSIILLESFDNQDDADSFMKNQYVLFYADEIEDAEEDVIISPDEMFIEDEIPFFEKPNINLDELPF